MFFSYKLVLSVCLITIFCGFEIKAKGVFYLKSNNVDLIKSDFPLSHKDLFDYLKSLENISKFASKYEQFLNIAFCFGLFIVNVNLRPLSNHPILTESFRDRIWNILEINDRLIENFASSQSCNKNDDTTRINQLIWTLMSNETTWTKRLKKFNYDLLFNSKMARMSGEEQARDPNFYQNPDLSDSGPIKIHPDWNYYLKSVNNLDENFPDPKSSDKCLAELSQNEQNPTDYYTRCHVSEKCSEMILNGMDFGYALTHRFLYLVLARISRGCYIISPERDQELRNDMCGMMFEESKYLAFNGFQLIDLLFEQVSLCSLEGHAQFLRHPWLSELLSQQSPYGCFNQNHEVEDRNAASVMNGECNTHVTSVTAAALASAVRFILEQY